MDMPLSERRQIENEMIFRRANELAGDNLDEIDANHRNDGNLESIFAGLSQLLQWTTAKYDKLPIAIKVSTNEFLTLHQIT